MKLDILTAKLLKKGFAQEKAEAYAVEITNIAKIYGVNTYDFIDELSEESDFSGYDQGQIVTTSLTVTITNLTPGRTYYIRVAARNQNGLGSFCAFADASCLTAVTAVTAVAKSS